MLDARSALVFERGWNLQRRPSPSVGDSLCAVIVRWPTGLSDRLGQPIRRAPRLRQGGCRVHRRPRFSSVIHSGRGRLQAWARANDETSSGGTGRGPPGVSTSRRRSTTTTPSSSSQSGERFEGRAHLQGVAPGGGRRHRERSASSPMGACAEAAQIGDIRGVRRASCLSREAGLRAASPQGRRRRGDDRENGRQGLGLGWGRPSRGGVGSCGEHAAATCWTPFMAAAFRASTAWQPNSMADQGKRWRGAPQPRRCWELLR
jgi:hypothetical protein